MLQWRNYVPGCLAAQDAYKRSPIEKCFLQDDDSRGEANLSTHIIGKFATVKHCSYQDW